jgi:Na+/proline symporter
MGVLIGSAVVPVAYCLCWKKCSARAAIIGAFSGQWAAIICWLSYTKAVEGSISVDTTGKDIPMLIGNLVAILFSALVTTTISLIWPDNYDYKSMREIPMVDDSETGFHTSGPDSPEAMEHAFKWILKWGGGLAFVIIILWPLLALPAGVFSKGYFTFWVAISIIWGLVATVIATVLPLWESRTAIIRVIVNTVTCSPADPDNMKEYAHEMEKPAVPRVQGGNPYVTPDSTVHNPKMQDVELGKKGEA